MTRLVIAAAFASLILAGCAGNSQDTGYQLGDGVGTVITLQARYCATADPERRAVLLGALRLTGLRVPDSGACTDILSLIDPAKLVELDVEQAREDQRRFQGENRDPGSAADLQGAEAP